MNNSLEQLMEPFDKKAMLSMINSLARSRRHTPEQVIEEISKMDGRIRNIMMYYYEMGFLSKKELDVQEVCDKACDEVEVNNQHIGQVFQWLIDNNYSIVKTK